MEEKPYKYDAFISYRHVEPDMTIAARLHTMLETFTLPKNLRAESNNQRFRVFRDREELSAADLSDSIQEALRSSANLIVICTRQTPLSPWCAKEIETFRKFHGDQGIIAVLAEGEPDESFPPSLLDLKKELTLEDGTTEFVERELLAAELRPDAVLQPDFPGYAKLLAKDSARVQELGKQSTALLKTEIYRIVAAMLGVSFGDLKQRDKERRLRRTLQLVSAGAAVMLVFGIVMLNLYWRADAAELQSTQQSSLMTMSRAMEQVRAGDRMTGALVGKLAMDGAREEMPAYDKLAAQYAGVLNDALYTDAYETTSVLDTGSTSPFFSISNTDARVLTSGGQNNAYIWDLETGEALYTLRHPMPVFSLSMSEDGRFAYTGALDGNLYEWDAKTGETLRTIPLSSGGSDIRPTADNRVMVAARMDGGVDLWNIETDEIISLDFPEGRRLHRAALHPDGKVIVTSLKSRDTEQYIPFGEVQAWSLQTGELLKTYDLGPNVRSTEFNSSPKYAKDGSVLVLTTPMGLLLEYADGTQKRVDDPLLSVMNDYALSGDGRILYAADNSIVDADVVVWDLEEGMRTDTYSGRAGSIFQLAASPDGQSVAAAWNDNIVTVWDTEKGEGASFKEIREEIRGHTGIVTRLEFSRDSAYLLSGSMDGTVRITPTTARDAGRLVNGTPVTASFQNEYVLLKRTNDDFSESYDLWDWKGEPEEVHGLESADFLSAVRVSPDGKTAAFSRTGYANAGIVNLETGEKLRDTSAHDAVTGGLNSLVDLQFSPDGTQLATLGEDNAIKRIDVGTGRVLGTITDLPAANLALRWSDDGALLYVQTVSGNTAIRKIDGSVEEEIEGVLYAIRKTDTGYTGIGLRGDELFSWSDKEGVQPISMTRERRGIGDRQLNMDTVSPDGEIMLTVVQGEVILTDTQTGERLRTLETAGNIARAGLFSPDGKEVLYTYTDTTAKVISLHSIDTLRTVLQERLGDRALSEEELEAVGR